MTASVRKGGNGSGTIGEGISAGFRGRHVSQRRRLLKCHRATRPRGVHCIVGRAKSHHAKASLQTELNVRTHVSCGRRRRHRVGGLWRHFRLRHWVQSSLGVWATIRALSGRRRGVTPAARALRSCGRAAPCRVGPRPASGIVQRVAGEGRAAACR